MAPRYAWVLNLDADAELARPVGYQPTARLRQLVERYAPLLGELVGDGCLVPEPAQQRPTCRGLEGRAWSPTPRALRLLAKSGASVPPAPSLECLQHVAGRGFNAQLGQTLSDAGYHTELEALLHNVEQHLSSGGSVLKRNHGFSGRGQRRMNRGPSADDLRWMREALALGGVQCEPRIDIDAEFAIHGLLAGDGAVRFGVPTLQRVDGFGAWLSSEQTSERELDVALARELLESAEGVALSLHSAGYFGPFGIDAYTYHDPQGRRHFNPKSDVNPRYTMGYAVGMRERAAG